MPKVEEEPRVTISASVAAGTRAELERRAAAADRTLSSEIRRALTKYVRHTEIKEEQHEHELA